MNDAIREKVWRAVLLLMAEYDDVNARAGIVQSAIAEFGPVPDSMGDAMRKAMANKSGMENESKVL